METERQYYIAGGADLEATKQFISRRQELSNAQVSYAEKLGGRAVGQGSHFAGIVFPKAAPDGWIRKGFVDGEYYFRPARRSKELKAISKEMDAIRVPGLRDFHKLMTDDAFGVLVDGSRILFMSWEWVGETLLLSVPIGSAFTPNGSTPLKMSDYWALKENASATSSAA